MRKVLSRNLDSTLILIAGYFLLAFVVRILRSSALEIDETQQALLSQHLLLGYGSQPFLYTWLQHGVNGLVGPSIASLSLLKNGLLFLCCLFFWLTARLLLRDRTLANIATLGVLTMPTIFVMAQRDLTHTVLALASVALFAYALFATLKTPSTGGYLLTGLAIGIGAIAKYNFVLVPIAAVIAIAMDKDLRQRLFDWRMLLTIGAAVTLVLPHCLWVMNHFDIATTQTAKEMRDVSDSATLYAIDGALDLLLAFLKGVALPTTIGAVLYFRDLKAIIRASDQSTRLVGRIILFSMIFVLMLVFAMGVTHMRQKWLAVYVLLWPLYLCLKVQAADLSGERKLKPMLASTFTLAIGFLAVLLTRGLISPHFERYSLIHIPYKGFAETLRHDGPLKPDYVIAFGGLAGGNLKIQFPDSMVLTTDTDIETVPAIWPAGAVILLVDTTDDGESPEDFKDALASLAERVSLPAPTDVHYVNVPYGATGRSHRFYYSLETAQAN
ncbi:glycosyltransferase family 39 protein [uncultured Agrobacterium sp.]|uniref:ArnT family glycosyltransferase n=1 Tax=uncultured Agrobacterium sp. TaxID=157277 RepID=UPI0025F7C3CF|nr:glycosyltransferase family 39 protein [uncultured Agrobacterium sp.]